MIEGRIYVYGLASYTETHPVATRQYLVAGRQARTRKRNLSEGKNTCESRIQIVQANSDRKLLNQRKLAIALIHLLNNHFVRNIHRNIRREVFVERPLHVSICLSRCGLHLYSAVR